MTQAKSQTDNRSDDEIPAALWEYPHLTERLGCRSAVPVGLIDVGHPQYLYTRNAQWLADKFPLLADLMAHYGIGGPSASGQPELEYYKLLERNVYEVNQGVFPVGFALGHSAVSLGRGQDESFSTPSTLPQPDVYRVSRKASLKQADTLDFPDAYRQSEVGKVSSPSPENRQSVSVVNSVVFAEASPVVPVKLVGNAVSAHIESGELWSKVGLPQSSPSQAVVVANGSGRKAVSAVETQTDVAVSPRLLLSEPKRKMTVIQESTPPSQSVESFENGMHNAISTVAGYLGERQWGLRKATETRAEVVVQPTQGMVWRSAVEVRQEHPNVLPTPATRKKSLETAAEPSHPGPVPHNEKLDFRGDEASPLVRGRDVNVHQIAEQVERILARKLTVERERRGMKTWR